ncbi:MATE efflux family protein [Streptococcus urinalis FB127-CNA-2]|nr:MATE efflux family protein [Streptococcus urinalis FB127-CNA-2]VEF33068.1 Multidrug resistance protein mdtK [Streptococcus urinalis]
MKVTNVINQKSYYKEILNLALPAMIENILQMLMGLVDSYLVAQLGIVAITGVSVANNIISIYQAIYIALAAAVSSLIARSFISESENEQARKIGESLSLTIYISLFLGVITVLFAREMLISLGTSEQVAQVGRLYLGVIGGNCFAIGLIVVLGAIVRANGYPKLPMYVSLLSNIINIILSSLSILVWHYGIIGVATATVISRVIACLILIRFLPIKRVISEFNFKPSKELLYLSFPTAMERLLMRLGDVVTIIIVVKLGTKTVAGNAIGESITQFNYMPGLAMATATIILVARSELENRSEQKKLIKQILWLSSSMMLAIAFVVYIFGKLLSGQFTSDTVVINSSMIVILFSLIGSFSTSGTLIYTAVWQGLGRPKIPLYTTSFGMWVIRIGFGYLLSIPLKLGLSGVWIATVLDNTSRWFILKYYYKQKKL